MLTMYEAVIRGGIVQAVYRQAKANNKYIKSYDPFFLSKIIT